jgi:hypothetical protein
MAEDANQSQKGERRRWIRYYPDPAQDTFSHLAVVIQGMPGRVGVRNLSTTGLSLILENWVEPDTELTVELRHRGRMFACRLTVRVKYVVERPGGDVILGGAFTRKLQRHELEALLW